MIKEWLSGTYKEILSFQGDLSYGIARRDSWGLSTTDWWAKMDS